MGRWMVFLLLFAVAAGCGTPPVRPGLTPEEEARYSEDTVRCNKKADESARGFGMEGITWKLKRREIFDYCMHNKGWE